VRLARPHNGHCGGCNRGNRKQYIHTINHNDARAIIHI
jgi:hypothetical protein